MYDLYKTYLNRNVNIIDLLVYYHLYTRLLNLVLRNEMKHYCKDKQKLSTLNLAPNLSGTFKTIAPFSQYGTTICDMRYFVYLLILKLKMYLFCSYNYTQTFQIVMIYTYSTAQTKGSTYKKNEQESRRVSFNSRQSFIPVLPH